MKHYITKHKAFQLLVLLMMMTTTAWGAETYKLEQVTSVAAGEKYVFEQSRHVMNNTVSSSALQTRTSYNTTGLSGTETYVWTLETATGGYYMKNVSLSSGSYLNNSSSTSVSLGSKSSIWTFTFQSDNTVLIQNKSNNRFLGYTSETSFVYKAYANSNLSSYDHAIKVYKLVEESTDPVDPSVSFASNPFEIAVGATNTNAITKPSDLTVSYSSSDASVASVDASTGAVTGNAIGTATITASWNAVANKYNAGSVSYTVNVKGNAGLAYANASLEKTVNDANFTNPLTNPNNLTVTYSSSNTSVATVDNTGEVTIEGTGTATITATFAGNVSYIAGDASYTLTVTNPNAGQLVFVQTSSTAGTLTGIPSVPTGVTATFENTYKNNKEQLTSGNSMTLTISGLPANYKVTGITLEVKNNKSSGNGTATATIGSAALGTMNISGLGDTYQEKAMTITPTFASADLLITISATQNSVYCDKFVIDYEISNRITPPTFSPSGGQVAYGTQVTLTQNEADMIMYTTDGSAPSYAESNGNVYSTPIAITADMTIRAIAIDADENESEVATAVYTLIRPAAPIFSPNGGQVAYGTTVTITAPAGCFVNYTTDGSDPTTSSTATLTDGNTATVTINADMTIRAISIDGNALESSEASATYTILHPNAPTFSPTGGQVTEGTTVTITAPTGCTILYTTDGTDPYESSTAIEVENTTATVTINETTTIKAVALDANLIPSTVAEATFTVKGLATAVYRKVKEDEILTSGEYLIVYEDGNVAFNGGLTTLDAANNTIDVEIDNEEIESNPTTDAAAFTLTVTATKNQSNQITSITGTIKSASGYYIGKTNNDNGMNTSTSTAYSHEFDINTGDETQRADIESSAGAFLRYNDTSGQKRFRYFKSATYASQNVIHLYKKVPVITVSALGYGTMYYGDRNLIVPEGVRAHALTTNGNQLVITKTYAASDVIPAGTAVMLVETTQPYSKQQLRFVSTHTTGTAPADNYLQGTDEEEIIDDAGYKYYMLTTKSGVLGFYWQQGSDEGTAIMNAAHKAYLRVPTGAGIKGFTFDNLVTGITAINGNGNTNGNDGWYTLDGRRLSGPPTQQGIYIHNGRKEVVK